ncbi:hypothetical protein ACG7TL_000545 [Trametes sanguinea]
MALTMQFNADGLTLRSILSAARRTAQKYSAYSSHGINQTTAANLHALSLPLPESLVPTLVRLGVDRISAETISGAVTRTLLRLQAVFQADFKQRSQRFRSETAFLRDPAFPDTAVTTYTAIYQRTQRYWIAYVVEDFVPRLLRARSDYKRRTESIKLAAQGRPAFNHSAVPALEQFFSINPFPSRLEKFELASSCQMEYRQIHVWFQNRRSRMRKEGKDLRKPERKSVLPEEVENRMTEIFFPSEQEEEGDDEASSGTLSSRLPKCRLSSLLEAGAPSHAFPAPYPPVCDYDPFPLDSRRPPFQLPCPELKDLATPLLFGVPCRAQLEHRRLGFPPRA